MKKIFIIYFTIMCVLLAGVSYAGFILKKYFDNFDISKYFNEKKEENIDKIKEKEKELIRKGLETAQENIEEKVYEEATIHNPEGDLLPDNIDDVIKEEIKSEIN